LNLVTRKRSKEDERIVVVSLTQSGLDLEGQVADIQSKVACKTHLKNKDFNELKESLNQLAETMTKKEKKLDSLLK
jgi:DNA-binding MarR family transcriptional regulator